MFHTTSPNPRRIDGNDERFSNLQIVLLTEATRIYKLQKKAIRTISKSKYNAHTEPIFKKLKFLKLNDIFKLQQLKFYYKLIKGDLPKYFQHFSYIHNFEIHHHYTRETSSIFIPRVNHAYAQKHIRHNLIQTINNTPTNIIDKIHTHSLRGFLNYIKVFIFGNYEDHCFKLLYMQTLKYMLKLILLPDYYTINYLLMLCNNFILFVFI